jgi:hypothetical protein
MIDRSAADEDLAIRVDGAASVQGGGGRYTWVDWVRQSLAADDASISRAL